MAAPSTVDIKNLEGKWEMVSRTLCANLDDTLDAMLPYVTRRDIRQHILTTCRTKACLIPQMPSLPYKALAG